MKPPRKAIILAAGFGSRLLPLTLLKPKPLFPLWGKPVLGHTLELLHRWGVRDVLVNAHHHADQILAYLHTNPVPGLTYQLSYEPDILGTGGVLPKARWFLDDQPFWMINADVMAELDGRPLITAFQKQSAIASLWLHPERGPRTVEHRNGLISVFKSPLARTEGTATFCGLQLLSPRILKYLPESGFASIVDA
jgi:mannose-1-phosphate guanylyltransferase/phosphomannomutase